MAQVIWAESALLNLDQIAEYIALDKPSAAKNLVKSLFDSVKRLKQFPKSGKTPEELEGTDCLEIVVGSCRIFYRVNLDKVYLLYVMRSERKSRDYLLEERSRVNIY